MNKDHAIKILKSVPELLSTTSDVECCINSIIQEAENSLLLKKVALYYISEENAYLKQSTDNKCFENFCLSKEFLSQIEDNNFLELPASQLDVKSQKSEVATVFPLKIRQAVFGFILTLTSKTLTTEEVDALVALAGIAAYAIKDSELSNVFKIQLKALQSSIMDKTIAVKTIKEQNEKILEADKAKNEFIANISHELRTPLNAIIGFSEVLGSKIFGELNEKQAEYINDIYTSGVHLLGMINEILDISKLESNAMKLTYSQFVPNNAINEVLGVMKPLANKKSINVLFDNNAQSVATLDYQKFQQILYNLLSNAIKFTPENGKIEITTKETSENLIVSVKDSGNGIDKNSQEKIFDKFVQLENTYTKTGSSTGLGLTITKKFVEMMNGKIELISAIGEGANFIITLPVERQNG